MQADGLVMEIVKRFTERLHQIKDIMELQGSKSPHPSSSLQLKTSHFLINEKDNSTPWSWRSQRGRGKNSTNLSTEVQVLKTDTGNTD